MKSRKILVVLATVIAMFALSLTAFGQMNNTMQAETRFKVRIENISKADGLPAANGMKWPFAISPGAFTTHRGGGNPLFKLGSYASGTGLEAQAEDGNPEMLLNFASHHSGVLTRGVFNTPLDASMPGPVTPGAAFEFDVVATPGTHLFMTFMFGQSNDLFYGNAKGIDLFDKDGKPFNGDVTSLLGLYDAGTEVNEEPGVGPSQAPRQKSANTGTTERRKVGPVKDGFNYPAIENVLRITVTPNIPGM